MSMLCTADFDYTLSGIVVERKAHSNYNSHIDIPRIYSFFQRMGIHGSGKG